jgi:hypothetical protein
VSPAVADIQKQIEAAIKEAMDGPVLTEENRQAILVRIVDEHRAMLRNAENPLRQRLGFQVICDESNNTEADRQAGVVNYTIIPPPRIVLDFTILKDGTIIHKR